MKFGVADYGMNVWNGGLYDIEERLEDLQSLGYDGTERLEASSPADAMQKAALYHKMGMDFSTCRGANLQDTITWSAAMGKSYTWMTPGQIDRNVDFDLFCRRSNALSKSCKRWGIVAGIHNHMGQRVENQQELEDFLQAVPDAGIVFDTGHLSMAGGDPAEIVRKYHDRICVMHLKDVFLTGETREDGMPDYRFCELGAGNNGFDNRTVIEALIEVGYDGWVHIEHDAHQRDPLEDLAVSIKFLKDAGLTN